MQTTNLQRTHALASASALRQVRSYQNRRFVAKFRMETVIVKGSFLDGHLVAEEVKHKQQWYVFDTRKALPYLDCRSQADAVRIALHKNLACS